MENKMNGLTLGSLFDGSGGFPLGGILSGIDPLWASEIEPFAVMVTSKRLPQMKHYGDVSELDGAMLPPVDIITFGSPCQDMSIAGRRSGLDGERSGLFFQAIRIVKEMREKTNGEKPRFIVWENVPGAFSSNKGEDFKAVIEAIIGIKESSATVPAPEKKGWANADYFMGDGWSIAYRVLDAQWWGVPQRRSRIFLVADLAGECAPKILFESEGMSGYSSESFDSWKRIAGYTEKSVGNAGEIGFDGYNGCLTGDVISTIGTNCGMSSGRNGIVLNDQGGERMDISEDVTGTLRAEAHHPPLVVDEDPHSAGFCTEHSAASRSIGFEEERSPTLRSGVVPGTVTTKNEMIPLKFHPTDSRIGIEERDVVQTLTSRMGTGGNNVPLIMSPDGPLTPKTLKIRSGKEGGGKGALIQDDLSATLGCNNDQTIFQPMAFGICSKDSNSMRSNNPNSGFYEADTSRTLDANGGNPSCNQGGIAVIEGNGARPSHRGDGYKESEIMYTLNATETHAVAFSDVHATLSAGDGPKGPSSQMMCNPEENFVGEPTYGLGREAFNQGYNAKFDFQIDEEVEPTLVAAGASGVAHSVFSSSKASFFTDTAKDMANTLVASDYKDPPIVNDVNERKYIVRRLTPTECARLQGFPDWWCSDLAIEEPTDEQIKFWTEIWEANRKVLGNGKKQKSEKQIRKWLSSPHSDSAEYKLWGNGVALPCVFFVLAGISWAVENENDMKEETNDQVDMV